MLANDLLDSLNFLGDLSTMGFVALFWYVVLFELPRYGLSFLTVSLLPWAQRGEGRRQVSAITTSPRNFVRPRISVIVVGHSEEASLEHCVRSLRAQSLTDFEIIVVSDGSRDRMPEVGRRLLTMGLIDKSVSLDLRCGKSAGFNLACRISSGDIIVNVDCDCSYDRFALERIVEPFDDPAIGAVSGDILPRNGQRSLLAALQTIEYLIGISLGKRAAGLLDQVVCVSGAFGAFRREALASVGGVDPGGGEDLDLTMRLRARGWKICFEPGALCYTDVPERGWALVRQRLRWERDSVRIRFRKHANLMNPRSPRFNSSEALHQYDFLVFHVGFGFLFPFYLGYLNAELAADALIILLSVQLVAFILDVFTFTLAIAVTGRWQYLRYAIYLPVYGSYTGLFMRLVRITAYAQEWAFETSRKDSYVPERVACARHW